MIQTLSFQEILPCITGAVRTETDLAGLHLHRYSKAQTATYPGASDSFGKTAATSGIRLECQTDAREVTLNVSLLQGSSRDWYYFDAAVDGTTVLHDGNDSWKTAPEFTFRVPMDGAKHRLTITFPNLVTTILKSVSVTDCTVLEPVKRCGTLLCFGDSITQGYDAIHPSMSYVHRIADALDFQLYNKGYGGDIHHPSLFAEAEDIQPDCIISAYGTNDWRNYPAAHIRQTSSDFFEALHKRYPGVPVFVSLPIWRADFDLITSCGTFSDLLRIIEESASSIPDFHLTGGPAIVPHLKELFLDLCLHPNDLGFQFMSSALLRDIVPVMAQRGFRLK